MLFIRTLILNILSGLYAFPFEQDPDIIIEIVDEDGNPTNLPTSVTCSDGICRLSTVTFSNLYEYDIDGDGTLDDVTDGVKLQGMAILGFPGADGERRLYRVQTPPLRPLQETTTTSNSGTNALHVDNPGSTEVEEVHTDEDLREVIGSDNEMADTSFAMHVELRKPPKRDDRSSAPIYSLLATVCLAAGASFFAGVTIIMA